MKNFLKTKLQIIVTSLTLVITIALSIIVGVTVSGLNSQIDDLNDKIENINEKNTEVDSDINNLDSDINNLESELNNKDIAQDGEISILENNLSELITLLETLTSQVNQNKDNNKVLEETITELEHQINCLKGNHKITENITFEWAKDYMECEAEGNCAHCDLYFNEIVATSYVDGVLFADFANFEDQSLEIFIPERFENEELKSFLANKVNEGVTELNIFTSSEPQKELFELINEGLDAAEVGSIDLTISGATIIPAFAFRSRTQNTNWIKSLSLPDTVIIEESAFEYAEGLQKVDAPKVQTLEGYAFNDCKSLVEVNLPELTFANYGALAFTALTTINLPKLVTANNNSLFNGCVNLETVYLPELLEITNFMFYNCLNLQYIYVPKVNYIGVNAFSGAAKNGSVYTLELTTEEEISFGNVAFGNPSFGEPNPVNKYINLILNPNKKSQVTEKTFNGYTFNSVEFLADIDATQLSAEDVKTAISTFAVSDISIKLPKEPSAEQFKAIIDGFDASELESVNLTLLGVETIPDRAFDFDCIVQNVVSLNLQDVKTIGAYALESFYNLEKVDAPNAKTIGECAFSNSSIKYINVPLVETIGEAAFMLSNIEDISLPNLKVVSKAAFNNCHNLKSIYIPNATTIEEGAFIYCAFTELDLPNVTSIGSYVFRGIEELRKITFGANITHIDTDAFYSASPYITHTDQIDLVFASGQKNFTGDQQNGWTISEEDLMPGTNVEFVGYMFKSISIAE